MHELAPLIKDLAIILGVAGLVSLLFQKIRQPVVLGYLLAGAVIGPYTPPHILVSDIPNIQILSELGVIFLMFSLGLEFSFHKLTRVGFSAGITGLLEVVFMLLIGLATGRAIGWSFHDSLFLGAALAISSTTIIIKALEELKLNRKRFAEIIFGVLIIEDLLAILLLVGLSTIVATNNIFSSEIIVAAAKLILVVGSWFLIGYFLVPSLFRKIEPYANEEILTIVSIGLCLALVSIAAYFHYSTALGAFIMGSILAETPLVHRIEQLIRPIRNIFAAVFFVSIGMLIDPILIWNQLPLVGLLCVVTIVGKLVITGGGAFLTGQNVNNSLRIGFSMAQIGEFSFIIAGLGVALNAVNQTFYPLIVAVSAITTFTTPYLIKFSGVLGNKLDKRLSSQTKYFLDSYAAWIYRSSASSNQRVIYRKVFLRLMINGLIVAILFTVTEYGIVPRVNTFIQLNWLAKVIGWFTAVIIASPFIWGMLSAFRAAAHDVGIATIRSAMPIKYLSWLIVFTEITVLSIAYFDTWFVASVLLLIAAIFFKTLYKKLDKYYHWFEKQLVRNLQKEENSHIYYEKLAPWDTCLVEVEVSRQSPLIGKSLTECQLRQQFDINIVAIYRGSNIVFSPGGDEIIATFDRLVLLGNDEQIEHFIHRFINLKPEIESTNLLENFALQTMMLTEEHPIIGKTIRDSQLRQQAHGLIVGLERNNIRILNPDSATVLEKGDLLFIVGDILRLKALSQS